MPGGRTRRRRRSRSGWREHPTVTAYAQELAGSHNNLGLLLRATGDPAGPAVVRGGAGDPGAAGAEHPEMPGVASGLGGTLNNIATLDHDAGRFADARDQLLQAVTWQRKALAANPRHPQYRQFLANHLTNLIRACQGLNDADGAADAQRQLAELTASDPRYEVLDERLRAIADGGPAKDNTERLALAQRGTTRKRHALAARLGSEALDSDPRLADDRQAQYRYNAACSAALAAADQGVDDPKADATAKATLRAQALAWLQAELTTWVQLLESATPEQRQAITQTLAHWQQDSDLASLRGDAIDNLPEPERAPWGSLWEKVEALRLQAAG